MMALRLEVFETSETQTVVTDTAAMEEARLAAWQQGFDAGAEAAAQAAASDQTRITEDLALSLQAVAFTWHEARVHVLTALEPLLVQMTATLLPQIAHAALAPTVHEAVMPMARGLADAPVTLAIHPDMRPAVAALCAPFTLEDDPSLTRGQARLTLGQAETRIDLDRATADITAAIRGFFDLTEKDRRHG